MVIRRSLSSILVILAMVSVNIFHQTRTFTLLGTRVEAKSTPGKTADSHSALPFSTGEKMPLLSGEKAVNYLKENGTYASLGEAMVAVRYGVNQVKSLQVEGSHRPMYEADNPAQGFTTTFTPEGIELGSAGSGRAKWALELKLSGIGYGDQLAELSSGAVTVTKNRVELARTSALALTSAPSPQPPALAEWYVNQAEGLEQGITIPSAPGGHREGDWLRVAYEMQTTLLPRLDAQGQAIDFLDRSGKPVLRYEKLVVTDATERQLVAQMKLEAGQVVLEINDSTAVYPITIDPTFGQPSRLTASDGAGNDFFGNAVAISGETVVVGASVDDIGANANQGSAYVFVRNGTTWSEQQKLTASDGTASDFFGQSVAISGETVVVGANADDIGANSNQGSAYVFVRSGTTWSQQQKLTASDGAAGDLFGVSVAISGETVVAGASGGNIGANSDQGAAYVFVRSGTIWSAQQKLTASDGAAGDNFGVSVSVSGETAVVGALSDDIGANANQGSAYVFVRNGTTWTQQQQLTASDGAANDQVGFSVAVSGETVVVGAWQDDTGANTNQGSAYVFVRSGTTWSQQQKLTASDGAANDLFGNSVAISGETVVVGAIGDTIGANSGQGSAYVFVRAGTTWSEQQKLTVSDGALNDNFGSWVATSEETIVVGTSGDTIGANSGQGSASVFTCPATTRTWTQQAMVVASDGAANDRFGQSVAISGETVVVGAHRSTIGANNNQGSVYVFVRNGTTWSLQQKLTASDGATGDLFGGSVAISGETVVVGASDDDIGANANQGSAYVFVRNGTTWSEQQKLTASDGTAVDLFGLSVAISGETVVVGTYRSTIGAITNQGSAYVFVRNGTTWSLQQKLTASDGASLDQFGFSVAISGETVVIGANFDDIGANTNQGSAYVFVRNGTTWSQQQKLTASDGALQDQFGVSVAISGETVVIGASGDDIGANSNQGSAFVFVRSGTTWSQQQQLIVSDGEGFDQFGFSVAISGEMVMIGANGDDIGANSGQGSASVFVRSGTTWSQQQQLAASDGAAADIFGWSVAISGETVVVGANSDDIGANGNQGSAYMFVLDCMACQPVTSTVTGGGTICAGDTATVMVTVSGGTPPYTVTLDNGGGTQTGASPLSFSVSPAANTTYAVQSGMDSAACPITGSGSVTVTVTTAPTLANAGPDQAVCNDGMPVQLDANTPAVGSGSWSVVSGPNTSSTQFAGTTNPDTMFTPAGGAGDYVLQWVIANVPCPASTDTVTITVQSCIELRQLFVADTANNRIQKFDGADWTLVGTIGVGSGVGKFRLPEAVAADVTGNKLYVADTGNNRIQWSTDGGMNWAVFAPFGVGVNQVRAPQGVALDAAGNVYVADTGNNRVLRFEAGVPGTGEILLFGGEVNAPQGLAIDAMFNLYVADTGNDRVLKIPNANQPTPGATVIVARIGSSANQVRQPQGVAVDNEGTLYVADTGNDRVLEFVGGAPGTGVVLATIGSALGQVRGAEGVSVNVFAAGPLAGMRVLAVGDTGNNRLVGMDLGAMLRRGSGMTVGPEAIAWQRLGTPNNIGIQIGQFRNPSKIK